MMPVDEQQKGFLMKRLEDLDTAGVREKLDYITWLYGWHSALETLTSIINEQKIATEVDIERILREVFENTFPESSGYSHILEHISKCHNSKDFDVVLKWVQKSKIKRPKSSESIIKRKTSRKTQTQGRPRTGMIRKEDSMFQNNDIIIEMEDGTELNSIRNKSGIRRITVNGKYWLDVLDLNPLYEFSSLETLVIDGFAIQDISLEPLSTCEKLTNLTLTRINVGKIDLQPLSFCGQLEEINIVNNTNLRRIDLSPLQTCYHLKKLDLAWNMLECLDLSVMKKIPTIEELTVCNNWGLQQIDLTPLQYSNNLRVFNASFTGLKDINLLPLMNCYKLEKLSIIGCDALSTLDVTPLFNLDNDVDIKIPSDIQIVIRKEYDPFDPYSIPISLHIIIGNARRSGRLYKKEEKPRKGSMKEDSSSYSYYI